MKRRRLVLGLIVLTLAAEARIVAHHSWRSLRGGDDSREEQHSLSRNNNNSTRNSTNQSPLLSIFQRYDDIKFSASLEPPQPLVSRTNETTSRGGALVATVKKKPSNRLQSWLQRATPTDSTTTSRKETLDVSSWWVKTRVSFLPVRGMEQEEQAVALEQQDEVESDKAPINALEVEEMDESEEEEEEENSASEDDTALNANDAKDTQQIHPDANVMVSDEIVDTAHNQTLDEAAIDRSPFESSGYWESIDNALTFGFAQNHSGWKVSRRLRGARKLAAKYTGLHGVLSGKNRSAAVVTPPPASPYMSAIRRRLAAIDKARKNMPEELQRVESTSRHRGLLGRASSTISESLDGRYSLFFKKNNKDDIGDERRKERVKEIDRLFIEGQQRLQELACEKDMLQRRPNPLWNYTTIPKKVDRTANATSTSVPGPLITASRRFSFPPPDLVEEYLDMLFLSSRLLKLNHTDLWKNMDDEDDDDELLDDFAEVGRKKNGNGNSRSNNGNWWLRNGLGEKIGEAAEKAAYKSVCASMMSVLARSISSIHGVNVMKYSDIRLSMEQAPNLPPLQSYPGIKSNYAKQALQEAMRRGAQRNSSKRKRRRKGRSAASSSPDFVQHAAVVETMLSHCQIAAPLFKLFPLAWQRALLGNIVTLVTAVMADFCEGIEFRILGHRLTFAFTPLTEEDILRGMTAQASSRPRPKPAEFEAAVAATAAELNQELKFLDRWHERALGSGMLRSQIATLIARLVLTLIDDVLCGAKMDLWANHAGGPRLVAGLEHRTTPGYMDDQELQKHE